jgi:formylglycine-generating enzyme required for sulfatase activity
MGEANRDDSPADPGEKPNLPLGLGAGFVLPPQETDRYGNPRVRIRACIGSEFGSTPYEIWDRRLGVEFVWIRGGTSIVGSPECEVGREDSEGPLQHVDFERAFYLAKYPVTQEQWEKVMGYNHSEEKGADLPATNMVWHECQEFIRRWSDDLVSKDVPLEARLPSEAEWEHACRAGARSRFCGGDQEADLRRFGWSSLDSIRLQPVGRKLPNAWGLYDMHGNVFEWCEDVAFVTLRGMPSDGSPRPVVGEMHVARGGSWLSPPKDCRCATRKWFSQSASTIGFRIHITIPEIFQCQSCKKMIFSRGMCDECDKMWFEAYNTT